MEKPLGLLVCVLLAGCLEANPNSPEQLPWPEREGPDDKIQAGDLVFEIDLTNCITMMGLVSVPNAATDAWLPPGFQPLDTSDFLLPTPIASGSVFAHVTLAHCDSSSGRVEVVRAGFSVTPPASIDDDEVDFHFYDPMIRAAPSTWTKAMQDQIQWTLEPQASDVWMRTFLEEDVPAPPTTGVPDQLGAYAVAMSGDELFSWAGLAAAPLSTEPPVVRYWSHVGDHLAYAEFQVPARTIQLGNTVWCSFKPESIIAAMVERTSCALPNQEDANAWTLFIPPTDLPGSRFVVLGESYEDAPLHQKAAVPGESPRPAPRHLQLE